MKQLLLLIFFQAGWFACVLGGANHLPWLGPVVMALFLTLLFRSLSLSFSVLWRIALLGMIGSSVDGVLSLLGVFHFPGAISNWSPPYLVALWIGFVANFEGPLSWLRQRYLLACVLGAFAGPLNYMAGMKFGAVSFGFSLSTSVLILAIEWALLLPTLLMLHQRMTGGTKVFRSPRAVITVSGSQVE